MISRWKYISITIVMGVVLLMFQLTNVMLERWNHYEENSYIRDWENLPKESDAYIAKEKASEDSRGIAVYIGSKDAPVFEVVHSWAVYTKQNFLSCETIEEYLECAKALDELSEKMVVIHSEDISWENEETWKRLETCASKESRLIFCGVPETGFVKSSSGLAGLLGISRVREEETTVKGLRLEEGFLLGGGAEYRTVDEEENARLQDMELTFPWYVLSEDAEIYMRGILEDESLDLEEMPPVIWRAPVKETYSYVVNGGYMEDAAGTGLLSAMWSNGKEWEIYPVVNAQNLVAINYPGLAAENEEVIQAKYGQNLAKLFQSKVWPVFIAAYRQNSLGLSCMIAPQFDYADENLPDQEQFLYYMKRLNEESAEAGLSGFAVSDTPLEQKLLEDRWFMEGTLPDYHFTSFYCPETKDLEKSVQDELLESLRTVITQYEGESSVIGYLDENVTRQAMLTDGNHYTYRQDFLTKCIETALGYTSVMVDMEQIAYPVEGGSDPLNQLSASLNWNLQNYFDKYKNFEGTTVSECDERIRTFLALDFTKRAEENVIYLDVKNPGASGWFILRCPEKEIQRIEGGQWIQLEDGVYLIETAEESLVITLDNRISR